MNNYEYYYEVGKKSQIQKHCVDFINSNNNWIEYEEFTLLNIEDIYESFVKYDIFLSKLYDKLSFRGAFLKVEKDSVYDWHTDIRVRKTSLNLLINKKCHSHTIFSKDRGRHHEKVCSFVELKYKPETYYILNTEIEHMVINFDPNRIILSISFNDDISYVEAVSCAIDVEKEINSQKM